MSRGAIPSSTATIITAAATTIVRITIRAIVLRVRPTTETGPATPETVRAIREMATDLAIPATAIDRATPVTGGIDPARLAMGATVPGIGRGAEITIRAIAPVINPVAAIIGRAEAATSPRHAPQTRPIADTASPNQVTSREPSTATTRAGLPVSRVSADSRA